MAKKQKIINLFFVLLRTVIIPLRRFFVNQIEYYRFAFRMLLCYNQN